MARPVYTLSIVVPVYNGARTVGELVEALSDLVVPGGHEIILVVDGSPDASSAVCHELLKTARVPLAVIDHARKTGADAVYTFYETKEHATWRNLGSRFTNRVADWLLDKPRGLYLSSFRCLSAFVVEQVARYDGPFPYIDGLVMQTTQRLERLPVRHLPRAEGRSNYNFRRLVRLWLNMFLNFSVMPLRVSSLTGLAFSILGGLGVLIVVVEALFNQDTPSGWGSVMAAVLLLSGVQLLILGVVGEYLGRLFLTMNRKPQSVVRSVERSGTARDGAKPHPIADVA